MRRSKGQGARGALVGGTLALVLAGGAWPAGAAGTNGLPRAAPTRPALPAAPTQPTSMQATSTQATSTQAAPPVPAAGAGPQNILPPDQSAPIVEPEPTTQPIGPQPIVEPIMHWTVRDAQALLDAIRGIDAEGLYPADYQPDALASAIAGGASDLLDHQASLSFDWLAEDLRDGRTPMDARVQWFAVDPDSSSPTLATNVLLARATQTHDVAGTLAALDPAYPDYAALRQALAQTPTSDTATRNGIRVNMDRWRWLPQTLGEIYLVANVPEFEVRLMRDQRVVRTFRTIVGKPGRTETPQLAQQVQAVVFNPTWTIPQSIIEHEHMTADKARAKGFKVTENGDGSLTIVQPPGDNNSLGRMKIDMPNPEAIYLHDTPEKYLFDRKVRAFSHGCIRTEHADMLGMTMAMLGAHMTVDRANALYNAKKYARIPMERTFPVYITYTTMGLDNDRQLVFFDDIYGRDAPVLKSFDQPRQLHTTQRTSSQEVIVADDPL